MKFVEFIKLGLMNYVCFGRWVIKTALTPLKYLGVILLAIIVLLSFAQNLPIPGNFKSLVVMSGSMEPKIHTGSVAIVKPTEDIKTGDIITFKDPRDPKNLITHRIAEENQGILKTKGDANNTPDNWEVSRSDVVGKVLFSIPFLGYAVNSVKQPQGFFLVILLPALLIIINEIGLIKQEFEKKYEKKKGNTATVVAVAIGAVFLTFAFSSGATSALLSDTETSIENTISVGVWDDEPEIKAGDVIINELMWTGSVGDSDDEWIELRNMTDRKIDLSGWQITKWVAGNHEELMLTIPDGKKISANGYFLISNFDEAASKISTTPDLIDSSVVLVNNDLQIKLYNGIWDGGVTLIDTADDGTGTPAAGDNSNKFSMERNDTPANGTQMANWHTCLDASSTGLYWDTGATEQGTPGALNLSENDPSLSLEEEKVEPEKKEEKTELEPESEPKPEINPEINPEPVEEESKLPLEIEENVEEESGEFEEIEEKEQESEAESEIVEEEQKPSPEIEEDIPEQQTPEEVEEDKSEEVEENEETTDIESPTDETEEVEKEPENEIVVEIEKEEEEPSEEELEPKEEAEPSVDGAEEDNGNE